MRPYADGMKTVVALLCLALVSVLPASAEENETPMPALLPERPWKTLTQDQITQIEYDSSDSPSITLTTNTGEVFVYYPRTGGSHDNYLIIQAQRQQECLMLLDLLPRCASVKVQVHTSSMPNPEHTYTIIKLKLIAKQVQPRRIVTPTNP